MINNIIEYVKKREEDLDYWSNGLDDGTYSSAKETYSKVIEMLNDIKDKENRINQSIDYTKETFYVDGEVIREVIIKYK